jgi:hypothetical protein
LEAGIGEGVIARLEEAGIHSLSQLRALGATRAVDTVCSRLGSTAWRNRRRSIERVLNLALA